MEETAFWSHRSIERNLEKRTVFHDLIPKRGIKSSAREKDVHREHPAKRNSERSRWERFGIQLWVSFFCISILFIHVQTLVKLDKVECISVVLEEIEWDGSFRTLVKTENSKEKMAKWRRSLRYWPEVRDMARLRWICRTCNHLLGILRNAWEIGKSPHVHYLGLDYVIWIRN